MATIAFYEIKPEEHVYLKDKLKQHTVKFFKETLNAKTAKKGSKAEIICVRSFSKVDAAVLKQLPQLDLLVTRTTGTDHVNIDSCKDAGVMVCNVPLYAETTVAEYSFALLLSLTRNVQDSHCRVIQKDFDIEGLMGFDLKDKTIGIIGGGAIGMHVAGIAKGFGMKGVVYDIVQQPYIKKLGFKYVSLDKLLKQSDVVTVHVPYIKPTYHLLNSNNIPKMKKGAFLINTARGEVIETKALYKALKNGTIRSAGLDVIEGEAFLRGAKTTSAKDKATLALAKKVLDLPNVVYTPHIGFYSLEAIHRFLEVAMNNMKFWLKKKPINVVGGIKCT